MMCNCHFKLILWLHERISWIAGHVKQTNGFLKNEKQPNEAIVGLTVQALQASAVPWLKGAYILFAGFLTQRADIGSMKNDEFTWNHIRSVDELGLSSRVSF